MTRYKRDTNATYSDEYYSESYEDSGDIHDDDTRIVNGYAAGNRPWLTLLHVAGGACGGALINHK